MLVKICGFTREQDVELAIDAGADALGFVFDSGSRRLDVERGRQLVAAARARDPRVECIAVTGQLGPEQVASLRTLGFDGIQTGVCPWQPDLADDATYLLPAFFDSDDLVQRVAAHREAQRGTSWAPGSRSLRGLINIDSASGGGTGQRADWTRAADVCAAGPSMLAGGLTPDNVAEAIAATGAAGVDVCSGVELRPGIKDGDAVRAFVDAAHGR